MDCGKLLKILVHALVIGVVILFLMLVAMYCNGCGKTETPPKQYAGRMKLAGDGIYIDTETGVCYFAPYGRYPVVMVDHDGKPFVANGWRDYGADDNL